VILTNGDDFAHVKRRLDRAVRAGDVIMEIAPVARPPSRRRARAARPAAPWSSRWSTAPRAARRPAVERGQALCAEASILAHGRRANVRSAVALMSLAWQGRRGDGAGLGAGREAVVAAVADLLLADMGQAGEAAAPVSAASWADPTRRSARDHPRGARGAGLRIGRRRCGCRPGGRGRGSRSGVTHETQD